MSTVKVASRMQSFSDPWIFAPGHRVNFRVRERTLHPDFPLLVGTSLVEVFGTLVSRVDYDVTPRPNWDASKIERTLDELHPGPPFKSGGPFRSLKASSPWYEIQGNIVIDDGPGVTHKYVGGFVPLTFGSTQIPDSDFASIGLGGTFGPSYQDPSTFGAAAYDRFKPKFGFDLPVALYETKDVPGQVRTSAEGLQDLATSAQNFHNIWKGMGGHPVHFGPKKVADHFLNHVFGWVPFLSDVNSTIDEYQNLSLHLQQVADRNGTDIRKEGTVYTEDKVTNVETVNPTGLFAAVYPFALDAHLFRLVDDGDGLRFGRTVCTTRTVRKVRFSGCFRYDIPSLEIERSIHLNDPNRYKDSKDQLRHTVNVLRRFGVRPSPTLLWKIMPWSWMVDWFTNVGHVISNWQDPLDHLTSKYAYIMDHTVLQVVNDSRIHWMDGRDSHCIWYQEVDSKRRDEASPFGFGLATEDLSWLQKSILLALGISHA